MTAGPFAAEAFDQIAGVGSWKFDNDAVRFAIYLVERSDVVEQLAQWRTEERDRLGRHPGGRPETFPPEALLVAVALAALHHHPLRATDFRDILFRHISASMRARLGVPDPPPLDDHHGWEAVYRNIRTRFHSLVGPIDPSPRPKNRRLTPDEFDAAVQQKRAEEHLTDDVLAIRGDRLTWVANALLEASLTFLPPEVREQWDGSVAVDATAIPTFARPERRAKKTRSGKGAVIKYSADPDGGLYVRAKDEPGKRRGDRKPKDIIWAYEATLVVSGNADPNNDHAFPNLVMGMAPLHVPGAEVGANAIRPLTSIAERGHPAGHLAGDRAYTNATAEHFQLPARALGYQPVLDYRKDHLGVQASHNGALHIEGAWYCPAIPDPLINATSDLKAGKIDDATWRQRIEARRPFRMRPKARPDAEGHQRLLCPASNGAPTGRCELKPESIRRTDTGHLRIPVTDAQRQQPPVVCAHQSSTFPPDAGAKLAQDLHYGSVEWSGVYHSLRNSVEGMNGTAKDGAYGALGDPTRRRIRGVAPQTLFTAFILAATNIRAIWSFRRHATPDQDGTLRKPRKRRRTSRPIQDWSPKVAARSGAPPP